jgi:transposase
MTLNSKVQVDIPEKGIFINHKADYHPVYKNIRYYRNKQGTPTKERVLIGKWDPETGKLIPNEKYWHYYGRSPSDRFIPTYETLRRIGGAFLAGSVMKRLGLTGILKQSFGLERSERIKTAVLYMVTEGNVFDDIERFSEEKLLDETPLDSQLSSRLFASVTHDEKMNFFKLWIERHVTEGGFLAYDVTSFSTYAKGITDRENGYNRDRERIPQINLGCYVYQTSGLPVFYVTYPGSITDKSALPSMMAYNNSLGIPDPSFVLARGFCSTANVQYMVKEGCSFILAVEKRHKTTRSAIDLSRNVIASFDKRLRTGEFAMTFPGCYYGATATMHVFFDHVLCHDQLDAFNQLLENEENILHQKSTLTKAERAKFSKYLIIKAPSSGGLFESQRDLNKITKATQDCGFFCQLTNTKLSSSQVLEIYRQRDVIEKNFDDIKNYISMKRLRTHNDATTSGKLFCAFVALITASEIGIKMTELRKKRAFSKKDVFGEMNKITAAEDNSKWRLLNPVTKSQREILKAFELSEDDLRAYLSA